MDRAGHGRFQSGFSGFGGSFQSPARIVCAVAPNHGTLMRRSIEMRKRNKTIAAAVTAVGAAAIWAGAAVIPSAMASEAPADQPGVEAPAQDHAGSGTIVTVSADRHPGGRERGAPGRRGHGDGEHGRGHRPPRRHGPGARHRRGPGADQRSSVRPRATNRERADPQRDRPVPASRCVRLRKWRYPGPSVVRTRSAQAEGGTVGTATPLRRPPPRLGFHRPASCSGRLAARLGPAAPRPCRRPRLCRSGRRGASPWLRAVLSGTGPVGGTASAYRTDVGAKRSVSGSGLRASAREPLG